MDTNQSLDRNLVIAFAAVVASLAIAWVANTAGMKPVRQASASEVTPSEQGRMKVTVTAPRLRSVQVVGAAPAPADRPI